MRGCRCRVSSFKLIALIRINIFKSSNQLPRQQSSSTTSCPSITFEPNQLTSPCLPLLPASARHAAAPGAGPLSSGRRRANAPTAVAAAWSARWCAAPCAVPKPAGSRLATAPGPTAPTAPAPGLGPAGKSFPSATSLVSARVGALRATEPATLSRASSTARARVARGTPTLPTKQLKWGA
jgi:hypothetical protein